MSHVKESTNIVDKYSLKTFSSGRLPSGVK